MTGITTLFSKQTAWFSSSVPKAKLKLWRDNGGLMETFDHAQFVFSQNAEVPDTKRIYSSEAYLDEHLAVFHASYITDCVKCGDTSKVPLGKYFLPPLDIQEMVRKQMKFIWEKSTAEDEDECDSDDSQQTETCTKDEPGSKNKDKEVQSKDYLDINSLPLITGIIEDCVPGINGFEVYRKPKK